MPLSNGMVTSVMITIGLQCGRGLHQSVAVGDRADDLKLAAGPESGAALRCTIA